MPIWREPSLRDCPLEDFRVALGGVYFHWYFHPKISLAGLDDFPALHATILKFAEEVITPCSLAVRPRSAPTPFVLGCEPKGACLREGASEGDVIVAFYIELLLASKLVLEARRIEDGVAMKAISRGLVDRALGEDSPQTNSFSASPPMPTVPSAIAHGRQGAMRALARARARAR